jgi:NADPH-dependent curcumin reductase CurA
MAEYTAIHLAKRPKASIIPEETFEFRKHPMPKESDLQDEEVIFQSLYTGIEPAMRGWMSGTSSPILFVPSFCFLQKLLRGTSS